MEHLLPGSNRSVDADGDLLESSNRRDVGDLEPGRGPSPHLAGRLVPLWLVHPVRRGVSVRVCRSPFEIRDCRCCGKLNNDDDQHPLVAVHRCAAA
jgi:hypothetical protein